jgi:hypothetical protein
MIDRFTELLNELSIEFGITLHPDKRGACRLKIDNASPIQLECDQKQESLLIATFICEVPPGKLRENIFKDALKANGPFPTYGTLSYSDRNNQLALFAHLRLAHLTGKKLAEFLLPFLEKANSWKRGVETGATAQLSASPTKSSSGMFGLK